MTAQAGDMIPDVEVFVLGESGPEPVGSRALLGSGRVVLFGLPGAFTPSCSRVHLPGFVAHAHELAGLGVDLIACVAVNDAWVMDAWARDQGADGILMVADGNGALTQAMGLMYDRTASGMGQRSRRYAAVLEEGVIQSLEIDLQGVDASSCEAVIARLGGT